MTADVPFPPEDIAGTGDTEDRLLLVSGLSGAGKSSALKILEDLGWEAVDNLPLFLLPALLQRRPVDDGSSDLPVDTSLSPQALAAARVPVGGVDGNPTAPRLLAVGIDSRTRGFVPAELHRQLTLLRREPDLTVGFCFFDCDPEVLQRRFTETRRRHPMATDRTVADGIELERELFGDLREHADFVIDTSDMPLPVLRERMRQLFGSPEHVPVQLSITSFSFRRGVPRDADLVFDVRFLSNPYYDPVLRPHSGLERDVQAHIEKDPAWAPFMTRLEDMLTFLIPRYVAEGKSYLTIAVGCTGGRHRSVFTAEQVAERLRAGDTRVTVRHRDIDR